MLPAGRIDCWGFRLSAKTAFHGDVTAGHSWSLLILDRELTIYS